MTPCATLGQAESLRPSTREQPPNSPVRRVRILLAVTRSQMAIVGAFFAVAFAISGIVRGDVAPGLVGGLLGGVLVYLVLQRVSEHHASLRRQREREKRS
jgi:hypothetical protein